MNWFVGQRVDMARLRRGRLFRKYFLLILALVCGALLISSAIGLYFSYQENQRALAVLQREKAIAAAARVEQFLFQIEQQLKYAALPQLGIEGLEQRRIEFLKLLRQADAVTDVAQIDARGREQISESRLKMSEIGTQRDWSQEPSFKLVRPGQTWFGPVYFRKETEPYMSVAVRASATGPVTVADVNLKFIWDVVSRIKVGQKGKAYVVDGTGFLVADPDIGLVLRKTDLSRLEQVKASLKPESDDVLATLARDHAGHLVLSAFAPIELREDRDGRKREPLGWKVFVEQPVTEVYAGLQASVYRSIALMFAGVLFSILAALWLAGNMVRPIRELQEGAQRIGDGNLDTVITVGTGDELEALADQFNRMTAQLSESYAGLERKVDERTVELQQTLEQQTATSEILKVISSSPDNLRPVFDSILDNATRLCDAHLGILNLCHEGRFRTASQRGGNPEFVKWLSEREPFAPATDSPIGRMLEQRKPMSVLDMRKENSYRDGSPTTVKMVDVGGGRSFLAVPLVKEGVVLGNIGIYRSEVRAFTPRQISMVQSFADQAVIAIENVRLFNETKEALERQTATSEILKVISSSTSDVQPVFDAIVQSAAKLFAPCDAVILMREGNVLQRKARSGPTAVDLESIKQMFPVPYDPERSPVSRALADRRVLEIPDTDALPENLRKFARAANFRSAVTMPLVRDDEGIGALSLLNPQPGFRLTEKQLSLLQTFADQAVIAIENVRLFNETKEGLEQQTAISEVLRVISSSPADVKPVLDAVAVRAARICDAADARIYLVDGEHLRHTAGFGDVPMTVKVGETMPLARDTVTGRAILERTSMHVEDMLALPPEEYPRAIELAQRHRVRTMLIVPLMRESRALGAIMLRRFEVRPFTEKQIALLKTFADQAAIAIENVRLFNETKEALEQQTATAEVLNVISGSITDARPVFEAISRSVLKLYGARSVSLVVRVGDRIDRVGYALSDKSADDGSAALWPIPLDEKSLSGRAILGGELVHIKDVDTEAGLSEQSRAITRQTGVRSVLLAPIQSMGVTTGALTVGRRAAGGFSDRELELIRTFADQAVIAMENVRLFREIQEKSAQLEIANKHKSDFLANMSHELRTPLNAIIGFSEVLSERMFGEINEKQADYLKDIHESGKHLLSLINDILDLSKIEAGRMDLEVSSFHLPSALSNAMTLVRERAQRHGIALELKLDKRLAEFNADERKFKQILLNLLSNAVKFTADGGRVDVSAKLNGKAVEIAVKDTGIGIAPEDQQKIFAEFVQVGRDYTRKAEGTGLGLALTKRFVELHGGEIRLESVPGKGSTFTFTIPIRA